MQIPEREIYQHFGSLHGIEAHIIGDLVDHAIGSVEATPEWASFNARQRLLTFFYAFFEAALDHRSFLLLRYPCPRTALTSARTARLRSRFQDFASSIVSDGIGSGELAGRGPVGKSYAPALGLLFQTLIRFYLDDESAAFEDTDAYIEKSTALAFDLIGTQAVDSAADLIRFLVGKARTPA